MLKRLTILFSFLLFASLLTACGGSGPHNQSRSSSNSSGLDSDSGSGYLPDGQDPGDLLEPNPTDDQEPKDPADSSDKSATQIAHQNCTPWVINDRGNKEEAIWFLYCFYLDRKPDYAGVKYWISEVESGQLSIYDVAVTIIQSQEFNRLYGSQDVDLLSLSQHEFILFNYDLFLMREAQEGGYNYWDDQLNNGLSRAGVLRSFLDSEEHRALLKQDYNFQY